MIKNRSSIDKTKILFGGNIGNQEFIDSLINKIKESFFLSPSYFQITKNNDSTLYDVWIQNETDNPSKDGITKKKIILYPGQILNWGDYINWTDQNEVFLVTEKNISPFYDDGKMERCNNNLKFKTSNGTIVEYPCAITMESMTRFLDIQNNKDFIIPKDIFLVEIQRNSDTLQIIESMRFILNNNAFRVVAKTDLVIENIIQLKMQSDLWRNGLDNVNNNGLADQSIQQTQSIPSGLTIQGSNTIKINQQQTYNVINYNVGESFNFSVVDAITGLSTSNASIVSNTGTSCIIKAGSIGGKQIKLIATDSSNNTITTSMIITISSGY